MLEKMRPVKKQFLFGAKDFEREGERRSEREREPVLNEREGARDRDREKKTNILQAICEKYNPRRSCAIGFKQNWMEQSISSHWLNAPKHTHTHTSEKKHYP